MATRRSRHVSHSWPRPWWDNLFDTARGRLPDTAERGVWWWSPPWTDWAGRDDRIAARVRAADFRPTPPRPFADLSSTALLTVLRDEDRTYDHLPALRELNRRPPEPLLLSVVEHLSYAELHGPLGAALRRLGSAALPTARRWASTGHPLVWTAYQVLAAHGDGSDVPALLAGMDWLDHRVDDRCGYNDLADGLARIGGPAAASAVPLLRRLWHSPHSYERASYLRALVALDPAGAARHLAEGLWDCESEVRLLAAARAPLDDLTRERLRYLRDDPIETAEVRATAAARLR
ncbi:hypothetical protein I0C86_04240 [Plantactinospora sp. S1510]|uniref:HEAT repeat domain-containing protein n=1 Tax=Plantactinospora alkalitolerans TaxID=2789879 RepID=A0ABS0GQ34_9ACTN|nr:hypothetical protein [Plantactinospora alkalitolerans]MBF9128206.1 hypothetical protein [Plantactinospora alkalitolerans]